TSNSYKAVISRLATEEWLGPSSAAMATKVTPHLMWMDTAATQAEQTAMQARAVVAAFDGAFALTTPPPVIAANRSLQASLIATNFLGQNTGAIMATEALYMEMWAQCATAMYGYAASAGAAA
ncbi:PPE family protein, partial [Mycolicibacterium hippocampi]